MLEAMLWVRRLDAAGGVADTADLHRLGLSDVDIRMFVGYGRIRRVRRGWYVRPDVDVRIAEACRLGGRLACISAMEVHGMRPIGEERSPKAAMLHIELRANSVLRVPPEERDVVCVHWKRRASPGTRGIVSRDAALWQAVACDAW
ncbi:type IV toxin-antitoxin system AbiEi family antitoxin domain-containing protein [Microbacterium sp.]|uniref:type IV toxin-antitoxin system AbiEi family antitoxin domain-containing protein n=1 Tax=Microbacterium sp. TaxID=51671 RepID=UPI003A8ED9A3